jgi:hypothetical protein
MRCWEFYWRLLGRNSVPRSCVWNIPFYVECSKHGGGVKLFECIFHWCYVVRTSAAWSSRHESFLQYLFPYELMGNCISRLQPCSLHVLVHAWLTLRRWRWSRYVLRNVGHSPNYTTFQHIIQTYSWVLEVYEVQDFQLFCDRDCVACLHLAQAVGGRVQLCMVLIRISGLQKRQFLTCLPYWWSPIHVQIAYKVDISKPM